MRGNRSAKGSGGVVVWVVAAGLAGLVAVYFFQGTAEPFRTTPKMDVEGYFEDARNLAGNVYRLEARVEQLLGKSEARGRLLAVSAEGGKVVAVLLPPKFGDVNVQKGQLFVFMVEVDETGLLRVRDLMKS